MEYFIFATDSLSEISSRLKQRFSNTVKTLKHLLTNCLLDTTIYSDDL